jgi:hypothetical protein
MPKRQEQPLPSTREAKAQARMQARLRESERLAAEWEASRDPREREQGVMGVQVLLDRCYTALCSSSGLISGHSGK